MQITINNVKYDVEPATITLEKPKSRWQKFFRKSKFEKYGVHAPTSTSRRIRTPSTHSGARWNYEPVVAERGTVVVGKCEVSTYWYNGLEGTRRRCVRVADYNGGWFYLDHENGSGTRKVFIMGGGPDSPHASLPVDDETTFIITA